MSTSQRTRWPIRRSASWVSLKLASTQISVSERTAIRLCPGGDVVAGVDAAAGHHAVDLADDVAVAEVQLGLGEVAPGLEELGLGLPDGGGLRHHPLQDAVDVPVLVAPGELVEGLPRRVGEGAEREAGLRHALEQRIQRLADPGERLVEVGGDVRQVLPLGVRVEAEGDSRLVDLLKGLLDRGLGRPLGSRGAGRTPRGRSRSG